MDMLVPITALIIFAVLALMYSGGYWGADPAYHSFAASIGNSSAAAALVWAAFGSVLVALLLYVPRRLVPFGDFMQGLVEGMKLMLPANIILVLAWTLSGVCRDLLSTPQFVPSGCGIHHRGFSRLFDGYCLGYVRHPDSNRCAGGSGY